MATRSNIGIVENNVYSFIYCHFDGYLSYNGKILINYYNSIDKIEPLLDNGSITSLDSNINNCSDGNSEGAIKLTLDYFLESNFTEDFNYFFKNGEWYYTEFKNKEFKLVKDFIDGNNSDFVI